MAGRLTRVLPLLVASMARDYEPVRDDVPDATLTQSWPKQKESYTRRLARRLTARVDAAKAKGE